MVSKCLLAAKAHIKSPTDLEHVRLGPISSVTVLGQNIIIINDESIALELMEKRSAKHSARPNMEFAMNMYGASAYHTHWV
jgi:hypothetical protein